MKLTEGVVLDDALELFHSHAWVEQKPELSAVQLAELIPVLAPLFQQARPKVQAAKQKVPARPKAKVDKGSQSQGRTLVAARSGGLCEICALAPAREWHHRKNRSQGGTWAASNGMHLCSGDHAWITEHPEQAARNGWTVRSHEDPAAASCYRRGLWVLLKDDGSVELKDKVA